MLSEKVKKKKKKGKVEKERESYKKHPLNRLKLFG